MFCAMTRMASAFLNYNYVRSVLKNRICRFELMRIDNLQIFLHDASLQCCGRGHGLQAVDFFPTQQGRAHSPSQGSLF